MSGLTHVCTYAPQNGHHPLCDTEAARWAYTKALSAALAVVDRAVTPLGYYGGASNSPWNQGYEQAKNEATNALLAALQDARALLGDGGVDPAWPPPKKASP